LFQTHNQKNGEIIEKSGKKTSKMGRKIFEEKNEEKTQVISLNNDQENLDFLKSKILDLENKLKKEKETKEEKLWEALNESQRLLKQSIEQNNNMIPRIGNNNNNKISINVILNEKCPDAMNLENFVKKMQVSIEDVMYTRTHGYVKGISNIMVKHLKDMPAKERPIHCSDQNNLQFYIKDENTWAKDDKNTKINKSINVIQRKQIQKIKDWTDKHPNYVEDDNLYVEYQQMVQSSMSLNVDDNKDIGHRLSGVVNIDDVVE
tara:strand:- start:418 stop:1203 length:786 start_codon:yes stop_codon:yes gene_type:complete